MSIQPFIWLTDSVSAPAGDHAAEVAFFEQQKQNGTVGRYAHVMYRSAHRATQHAMRAANYSQHDTFLSCCLSGFLTLTVTCADVTVNRLHVQ